MTQLDRILRLPQPHPDWEFLSRYANSAVYCAIGFKVQEYSFAL